eukprot:jgi/Bigna1/69885/fgenesh1_pg.10_\
MQESPDLKLTQPKSWGSTSNHLYYTPPRRVSAPVPSAPRSDRYQSRTRKTNTAKPTALFSLPEEGTGDLTDEDEKVATTLPSFSLSLHFKHLGKLSHMEFTFKEVMNTLDELMQRHHRNPAYTTAEYLKDLKLCHVQLGDLKALAEGVEDQVAKFWRNQDTAMLQRFLKITKESKLRMNGSIELCQTLLYNCLGQAQRLNELGVTEESDDESSVSSLASTEENIEIYNLIQRYMSLTDHHHDIDELHAPIFPLPGKATLDSVTFFKKTKHPLLVKMCRFEGVLYIRVPNRLSRHASMHHSWSNIARFLQTSKILPEKLIFFSQRCAEQESKQANKLVYFMEVHYLIDYLQQFVRQYNKLGETKIVLDEFVRDFVNELRIWMTSAPMKSKKKKRLRKRKHANPPSLYSNENNVPRKKNDRKKRQKKSKYSLRKRSEIKKPLMPFFVNCEHGCENC